MKAMCLRKAAWLATHGMHIATPPLLHSLTADSADLKEISDDCVRMHAIDVSPHDLYEQMLIPRWRLDIHHLQQVIEHHPQGQHIMDWATFTTKWPSADTKAKRALVLLTTIICCTRVASQGDRSLAFKYQTRSMPMNRRIPQIFEISQTHTQALDDERSQDRRTQEQRHAQSNANTGSTATFESKTCAP